MALAVWLVLVSGCGQEREKIEEIPAIDLLRATEVMDRTVETYEKCGTYRDSGVMTRTFRTAEGTQQEESQTFATVFERPYRFRFQCREGEHLYIIYADAATIRAWWGHQEGVQPMRSLDDAIGRAVGPSNGASHTIPRLLMPDRVHGRSLAELRGPWYEYRGVPLKVTYHPAALLRNPALKRPTWEDMQEVRDRLVRESRPSEEES